MEDVFGWVAVLVGAIAIRIWGIAWLDPALSIVINVVVLFRAVPILWRALRVLLQYVPGSYSLESVSEIVSSVAGVREVHDLHLWTLDGTYVLFSGHVVVDGDNTLTALEEVKSAVRAKLADTGIHHATLELESPQAGCRECDL